MTLLVLPACSVSTGSDKVTISVTSPKLTKADSALLKDCNIPVDIGDKALKQSQTEKYWIIDRQSLIECGKRNKGLKTYIETRDKLVTGE